jgi:NAD(P)-dependent dehydrogenase (short-subunit alcohol dehydrogenase family)
MEQDWRGRVVLVTGASRGLGWALARAAAGRGAHVLALARTVGGLEELDDAIRAAGGAATLAPLDVTDDEGLARLGAAVFEKWGRLDGWLHCAVHAPPCAPANHVEAKDLDRAWAVNARATQRLIRVLDPLLRAAPAGIAALMDDAREGQAFFSPYAATKAAARAFWTAWAAETARTPLRVRLAHPPAMPTATRARFYPGEDRGALTPIEAAAAAVMAEIDRG